jgi:hypothetical protein
MHPFNIKMMEFNKQDKDIKKRWLSKVICYEGPSCMVGLVPLNMKLRV